MDRPWLAEQAIDGARATRLVAERFPELRGREAVFVGRGWDNELWRFGDIVFRFPRRAVAAGLAEVELAALPWLALQLPLPVPVPSHVGAPGADYPWRFWGHRMLPGETLDRCQPSAAALEPIAEQLGAFLRVLHDLDPSGARAGGVPDDHFRGDLRGAVTRTLARMENGPVGLGEEAEQARVWLTEARIPPRATRSVVLHGDLYRRHVLVDAAGAVDGVIDWGDCCIGDAAVDLMIATHLPLAARRRFESRYGGIEPDCWQRARVRAVSHALNLLLFAVDVGDGTLGDEARRVLREVAAAP